MEMILEGSKRALRYLHAGMQCCVGKAWEGFQPCLPNSLSMDSMPEHSPVPGWWCESQPREGVGRHTCACGRGHVFECTNGFQVCV